MGNGSRPTTITASPTWVWDNGVAETVYQNRVGKGQSQLVYKKLWQFTGPEHAQAPTVTQAVFAGFKGE